MDNVNSSNNNTNTVRISENSRTSNGNEVPLRISSNGNEVPLRISENSITYIGNEEPVPVPVNPIHINSRLSYGNAPIRLPTDVCVPISGNLSDISLRSSEAIFRESELTSLPSAGIVTINSNPIARNLHEPLIPTADKPTRVHKRRFFTDISPLKKKESIYASCACSMCFLLFIILWVVIPRYPLPKLSNQQIILDSNNKVFIFKQTYSLYNNNLYTLKITNWNMNMTLTLVNESIENGLNNPSIILQTVNNELQIPARSTVPTFVVVFNNYTSNEDNFDSFAKYCNATQFETSSYSITLNFKSKFHPTFQYSGPDSTSNTPYSTPFSCTTLT